MVLDTKVAWQRKSAINIMANCSRYFWRVKYFLKYLLILLYAYEYSLACMICSMCVQHPNSQGENNKSTGSGINRFVSCCVNAGNATQGFCKRIK